MIDQKVVHIMEYQPIDSLGRGKEWLYAGIAQTEDAVTARMKELADQWDKKGKKISFRSHRYSHAHGKNA
jgi:hypothetical protein